MNNKNEIINHLNKELEHIKELDKLSDIKCYQFIKDNYKNMLLFYERGYPTYYLFAFIAQKILHLIDINHIISPVYTDYAIHALQPIYPNVIKYLDLNQCFKNLKFKYGGNIFEIIICSKICNTNYLFLKEKYHKIWCDEIVKIINSKKYR